jgi:hypothetical protein
MRQLLNPPPWGYGIDLAQEIPDAFRKTKDAALQANTQHDFNTVIEHVKFIGF